MRLFRPLKAAIVAIALLAPSLPILLAATPAMACVIDSDGDCYLHVTGSVDPSNGLNVRTQPWGTILDTLPYHYSNTVSCYVQASDGSYWDWIYDSRIGRSGWVYDPDLYTGGNIYQQVDQMTEGHCAYFSLGAPTGVTATPLGSSSIAVTWTDWTGGQAQYVVSNGNVSSATLPAGTTSYVWTGLSPNQYMCFTVAAKLGGSQSAWSPYGCTTTPVWCPTSDATVPSCDSTGAFQQSCDHIISSAYTTPCPVNDWDTVPLSPGDGTGSGPDDTESTYLVEIAAAFQVLQDPHAGDFLSHYLDDTGTDYTFDASQAYSQGPGFAAAVNATVGYWIETVDGYASTFDSGYIDFPAVGQSTSLWQSEDWQNAVGHGFYRVVGTLQSNGDWSVRLQLTSYYQFRAGEDFTKWGGIVDVVGADARHLEKIGWARNFREIGTATLMFDAGGNHI